MCPAQELGISQASGAGGREAPAAIGAAAGPVFLMPASGAAATLSVLQSSDGVTFTSLASETWTPPSGALREPSIARHVDGWYYLAYANGGPAFGIARSKDLRRWEFVRDVSVAASGAVRAPEWLRERDGSLKLVVSVASAGGGLAAQVLTPGADMRNWSAPLPLRGLDGVGDVFVVADGAGYAAAARDVEGDRIVLARAASLAGPWTTMRPAGWDLAAGAPALARLAGGGWRLYAGAAGQPGARAWYADSGDGMRNWSPRQALAGTAAMARETSILAEDAQAFAAATAPKAKPKQIDWDEYSLRVDGKRIVVWSGEMHPFRLPNPALWRDVIQKMKAIGFNAIAFYFDWGYHSPAPGVYDFSGIRNVERALAMAEEEGMYIIARTGPYVNAELSGGGYPGWMLRSRAEARTDDPVYLAAVDEWMTQINAIIARHQLSTGGGKVIAYQIENELMKVEPKHARQMAHLAHKARGDGIVVPFFHNAAGRLPDWTPPASSAPWANPGPTDLYAFDGYPGGSCDVHASPAGPNKAPDWGIYGKGGPKTGALSSPGTPGFGAEIGGGWFDYWGSNGTYECTAERQGTGYQRVFYGANLINRLTIHNIYMAFGGTSWGWLPGPVVYTSYDYGAAIAEDRGLRKKAHALKQQGMFVGAAEAVLAEMDKGPELAPSSNKVKVYHNVNRRLGTHVLFAVHDPSDGVGDDRFTVALATRDGSYTIPSRLNGQDGKMLLASYAMERQHLVYSSSELQTHFASGERDIVLLHGRDGEDGETVLRYASAPKVEVLAGRVASSWDARRGDLKLNYVHDGLARVRITGGGRAPLLLLLADEAHSLRFWTQDTPRGKVLELSTALLRSATLVDGRLALGGDTQAAADLQIWGPAFTSASFNGAMLDLAPQPDGSVRTGAVAGPDAIELPDLAKLAWTRRIDSLEAQAEFDDSGWIAADKRPSAAQTWSLPERGQRALAMSDYGFHHGDVWYRGHVDLADGKSNQLELFYGAGGAGMLQAWVDGRFLGQHELDAGRSFPETSDSARFDLGPLEPGKHVVAVMVRNNSHNWNLMADDFHREARGLIAASLTARGGRRFAVPIDWRIQGNQGGETIVDSVRGPLNNGGLHGERAGWHLPLVPAEGWSAASPGAAPPAPGTYWLRTRFRLELPRGHDVQLGLAFGDTTRPRSERDNRVLIFVNGWNMGQFIAHIGPQRTFVIPPGILDPNGDNTIALAVTTDGQAANALEAVKLVVLRAARGGVPLETRAGPALLPAAVENTDPARAQVALPEPADPALPSLILVGDSTVRNGRDDGQGKGAAGQWGWGNPLASHIDAAKVNLVNRAVGGLSSRTYLSSGHWERTLALVKAGDVVLMQFGHNDASALNDDKRARGTIRGVGEETEDIDNGVTGRRETVHSYGWYLRRFIADIRARGATPVVVSPVPRKAWDDAGRARRDRDSYAGWAAAVASREGAAFIDLNKMAARRYDELGRAAVMALFPATTPEERIHTNRAGAALNAQLVAAGLASLGDARLASWLKPGADARDPTLPTLFLVGDSTVKSGGQGGAIGWGERIAPFFDARRINLVNAAIGGRSSRTFFTEGRWEQTLGQMKRGDFAIIQFGHNDGGQIGDPAMKNRPSAPGVGPGTVDDTRPDGSREQVHSFGWYMGRYVADATAKGVTVILASPVPHRDRWQDGRDFAAFAEWDRQVAAAGGALFMDLTMLVADGYHALGAARVDTFFADARTHTSGAGADFNAARVADGLRALPGNPLRAYFSETGASVSP